MGMFEYSTVRRKLTPEVVERDLQEINEQLWGQQFRVDRIEGIPINRGDDRQAKWCFIFTDPEKAECDAAFSITLLRDNRLEFKVPIGYQSGPGYADQQMVRARLVRKYNETLRPPPG